MVMVRASRKLYAAELCCTANMFYSLCVEIQGGSATLASLAASYKVKGSLALTQQTHLRYLLKRNENTCLLKDLCRNICAAFLTISKNKTKQNNKNHLNIL